ncbi:MAG TPA: hypothetical protein VEW48_24265 [Thermoanaerobaculia bacterium]|nr:hypothetical protein [Thermoanaerobaculia bacterium]
MPSFNAFADVNRDLELLLDAAERSPEIQAGIEVERQAVAEVLADVRSLKARQDELTALRQQVTQQLKAAIARGKDAAMQLRAVVKAKFGPRNERLVHFKMAPLRKRPRKPVEKPVPEEKPEEKPPV